MSDENNNVIEDSNTETQIDFSDFDSEFANANKTEKEKIIAEVEREKETKSEPVVENSTASSKLEEAISEESEKKPIVEEKVPEKKVSKKKETSVTPVSEVVKEEKTETSKKKSDLILDEDEIKERSKIEITSDDVENEAEDDEIRSIINSQEPNARQHRVVDDESESKEDFIIDTDETETIIEKEEKKETVEDIEEKRKKVDEYFEKRTGFKVYGGEGGTACIFASDNPNIKALREFDIPSDKIKPISNSNDSLRQSFLDQYITLKNAKDSTVVDHRITRFPLLLSGYYAEMTDYSMGDLTKVIRTLRNPDLSFVRKFQQELLSLYEHISWTNLKPEGEKLTFEEWLSSTKYQDLGMFYFGAYDATYPGESKYDITCGNCHQSFTVSKKNRALSYLLQNGKDPILTDRFIYDVMHEKIPASEFKKTIIYSKANTPFDEKVLLPHNIKVSYNCPSLLDILEYLSIFEDELSEDFEDLEALIDDTMDGHNVLVMYTMIQSLILPVNKGKNAEGKNVISFYELSTKVEDPNERMENRRHIVSILKTLPTDEFAQLFKGKEIAERKRLVGITNILHNITCTECGSNISRIPIDMRVNFFTRAATAVDQIDQY